MAMNPVILHIPHAATDIPADEMDLYEVPRERLAYENLRLADLYTDELYDLSGAARAVFALSRFCVDVERFSDDAQESMAARGMGALYRVGVDLNVIRPDIPGDRAQRLLDRYYWPHHNALDALALERLERFGECLVFDCHSYPSKPLAYELGNASLPRPQIGIGTDPFHTPPALAQAMAEGFRARGYDVGLDTPFTGALVPNAAYGRDARVMGVMIEVRKDLYMDEETGRKNNDFPRIRDDLREIMAGAARKILKNPA